MLRGSPSKALTALTDELQQQAGRPVSLKRALSSTPLRLDGPLATAEASIDASAQMPWEALAEAARAAADARRTARATRMAIVTPRAGEPVAFGKSRDGRYGPAPCPDLDALGRLVVTERAADVEIDLTAVNGFSSSKADLRSLESLEEMVTVQGPLANPASWDSSMPAAERIEALLRHDQIRLRHPFNADSRSTSWDTFRLNAWDPNSRLQLMNDGGSHHMAHAAVIARNAYPDGDSGVKLTVDVEYRTLSTDAVMAFNRDYEGFLVPAGDAKTLMAIYDALEAVKADHVRMPFMPYFFGDERHGGGRGPIDLVLLPRSSPRAMACAAEFRQHGLRSLNTELSEALRRCATFASSVVTEATRTHP